MQSWKQRIHNFSSGSASIVKVPQYFTFDSGSTQGNETEADILAKRLKDIDFGKSTIGYKQYIAEVPKYAKQSLLYSPVN